MSADLYYPCLVDDATGQLSRRVGPAMSHREAIDFIKQHYSGAWQHGRAAAQPVSHQYFAGETPSS
jgi:hypothetical protein